MDEQRSRSRNPTDLPLSADIVRLITVANDESTRRQHEYIGTEHFMLALTHQADAAATLVALAIEPERIETLIDETIVRGNRPIAAEVQRPFTSRTNKAFSLAADAARELGHAQIGVPHLLVGLMRERANVAAQVLTDSGLTVERAFEFARGAGATG